MGLFRHNKANNVNSGNGAYSTDNTVSSKARNPFHWEIPFLYILKITLAAVQLGFVASRYKKRHSENLGKSEVHRLDFLFFAAAWTILGSIIFMILSIVRRAKSYHHSIFSTTTSTFWIIGGALIHTISTSLACGGKLSPLKSNPTHALNCHQLKIIEWLSWGLVILTILSAILTWFLARRRNSRARNAGYPRDEKLNTHNQETTGAGYNHAV